MENNVQNSAKIVNATTNFTIKGDKDLSQIFMGDWLIAEVAFSVGENCYYCYPGNSEFCEGESCKTMKDGILKVFEKAGVYSEQLANIL